MMNKDFTIEAIKSLRPTSGWGIKGSEISWELNKEGNETASNIIWNDTVNQFPSRDEIEQEIARLQAEWSASEYQRQRKPEYPLLADLADALYWQAQGDESKMTEYLAAVNAVKAKYPKGVA
jgi:hypothetical protein